MKIMKKSFFCAVFFALCLQSPMAWCQNADDNTKQSRTPAHKIEPMDVRASAGEEPPDSPLYLPDSAKSAIWTIDQSAIQSLKARDVFDVLSYSPGVQLSFQGRKGIYFISSRGGGNFIGGSSFAVLLDGAYLPWTQSSRILASLPLEIVESIQVVRDSTTLTLAPLSGLGSTGAIVQGVVIIKTRKPQKRESQIKVGYGNLDRYKAFLSHGDRLDNFYYALSYNKQHDDGRDDWNNASDSDSLLARGGYEGSGIKADVSVYADWASRQFQRATRVSKTADQKWEYEPLDTLMATAAFSKKWSPSQTTALGLYTGKVDTTVRYRSWSKNTYSEHEEEENVLQAELKHIVVTGNNNLRFGGQAIFWDTPEGQFYYQGIEREEELYSLYVHDEYSISKALKVDAGARMDRKHISKGVNKYAPTDATPTVLIDDQWAEPNYSVAAGASYAFSQVWDASLRTSYTQQGADSFLVSVGNKELADEKQWRFEAGLSAKLHPALQATATAFYYDIRDMRQRVGSIQRGDDIINVYDNADVARSGMELFLRGYAFTPKVTYALSYSYQRSNNDIDDQSIPHHIASLRLGYRLAPFEANLLMRHVSEYDSNQFAADKRYHQIGDFSRVDANVSYDFTLGKCRWRATLFAQNLTDEEYETRLGWKDVGLTYGFELGVKF